MKVYGDIRSGNCYKIKFILDFLGRDYQWQHVDILKGESRNEDFLARNPNGKIPVLQLSDGRCLAESNAILNFLADGTPLLPADPWQRAQVLAWQFFEQYSHEPWIAVARFIQLYLGLPEERRAEHQSKLAGGYRALAIMEHALSAAPFLTGDDFTIADISLYAYTHVAHEGGFVLDDFKALQRWLARIEALPGYSPMQLPGGG